MYMTEDLISEQIRIPVFCKKVHLQLCEYDARLNAQYHKQSFGVAA